MKKDLSQVNLIHERQQNIIVPKYSFDKKSKKKLKKTNMCLIQLRPYIPGTRKDSVLRIIQNFTVKEHINIFFVL